MTKPHEEVATAALALPPEARAELAERLLSSLDDTNQPALDAAVVEEIERRIDQIDRGEVTLLPGDEVMARLRARFE